MSGSCFLSLVLVAFVASAGADIIDTYAPVIALSVPAGSYQGSTTVLDQENAMLTTLTFTSPSFVDVEIAGVVNIRCQNEPFSLQDGDVSLPGASFPGSCLHSALAENGVKLAVSYEPASDSVLVALAHPSLVMKTQLAYKTPRFLVSSASTSASLAQLVEYAPLFNLQDPAGEYQGKKSIFGVTVTATVTILNQTAFNLSLTGAVSIRCDDQTYSYSDGSLTIPHVQENGDCIHDALSAQSIKLLGIDYSSSTDTITIKVKKSFLSVSVELDHQSHRLPTVSTSVTKKAVVDNPLAVLYRNYFTLSLLNEPSGSYTGSKSILGTEVKAHAEFNDPHLALVITGPLTLNCSSEEYTYANSVVSIENLTKSGDCVHDALSKYKATLSSVAYDTSADTITITVKYSFLKINFELKKDSRAVVPVTQFNYDENFAFPQLFATFIDVFMLSDPSGAYSGSAAILGSSVDVKMTFDATFAFDAAGLVKVACDKEAYSYANGVVTATNVGVEGDCLHDALDQYNVQLESITYDQASDEVSVELKFSLLRIPLTLSKDSRHH